MTRAQLTGWRGRLAVMAIAAILVACSSDSDSGLQSDRGTTPATTGPSPATTETDSPAAPTTSDPQDEDTSTLAAPTDTDVDDQDPSDPDDVAEAPPTTQPPDPADAVDALRNELPGARALGLRNWNVLVHTALQQGIPADEIDPFEGLVDCPPRARLPGIDAPWIERRFRSEPPVERVTTVRVVMIDQDADEHEQWVARLQRCEPITDEVWIDHLDRIINIAGVNHDVSVIDIVTPATGVVPFPAQAAYATAHAGDRTVAVAVFGLDDPIGFVDRALEHLATILVELD